LLEIFNNYVNLPSANTYQRQNFEKIPLKLVIPAMLR